MILDCGKTGIDGTYLKYKSIRINPDMDLERVLKFVASQDVKNELEFENRFGLPEFFNLHCLIEIILIHLYIICDFQKSWKSLFVNYFSSVNKQKYYYE
ncbi:MAG: hypothetical protein IJS74_02650 [Clostridia bacterium]|nr:hypothetical protein [Clostridia bacterium]